MAKRTAVCVDVWRSYGCDTDYSISVCDEDGEEITCIGGDDDLDTAWAAAVEYAVEHGIEARAIYASGEVMDGYSVSA